MARTRSRYPVRRVGRALDNVTTIAGLRMTDLDFGHRTPGRLHQPNGATQQTVPM